MRRPEYFYEKTADKLGLSVDLVTKVNKFFWKYGIKEKVREGNDFSIYIKSIGTLYFSLNKIKREIIDIIGKIRAIRKIEDRWEEKEKQEIIERYKEKLRLVLQVRNTCATGRNNVKKQKAKLNEQAS